METETLMSMLPIPLEGRTEWVHVLAGRRAGAWRVILGADDEFEVEADRRRLVDTIERELRSRSPAAEGVRLRLRPWPRC